MISETGRPIKGTRPKQISDNRSNLPLFFNPTNSITASMRRTQPVFQRDAELNIYLQMPRLSEFSPEEMTEKDSIYKSKEEKINIFQFSTDHDPPSSKTAAGQVWS